MRLNIIESHSVWRLFLLLLLFFVNDTSNRNSNARKRNLSKTPPIALTDENPTRLKLVVEISKINNHRDQKKRNPFSDIPILNKVTPPLRIHTVGRRSAGRARQSINTLSSFWPEIFWLTIMLMASIKLLDSHHRNQIRLSGRLIDILGDKLS